jgi:alginate O-acetyltransferase complex protein AlgI
VLFNSYTFAAWLGLMLPLYWSMREHRARLLVLLAGSFIFYGWNHWPSTVLLALTIGVNYLLGLSLQRNKRPLVLGFGIALNLSNLAWFKYAHFLFASLQHGLDALGFSVVVPTVSPWLPLGISFFTFQVIAYLVDVYRGEVEAERSLLVFAVFKCFFAQLIAGPIMRAKEFLPQLRRQTTFDAKQFHRGLFVMIAGLFLKCAVADVLAQFANQAFTHIDEQTTTEAWLGMYAYAFQLFADFWGYSTMAVGLGLLFGLELTTNFEEPYLAPSLQAFWRRWHVTLSVWFRDYLYIPLGGNRGNGLRNLLITMTLAGLWHGAGFTFILWGFLHGAWLVLERLTPPLKRPFVALRTFATFQGVCLLWVLFRAPSTPAALAYYGKLLLPPYSAKTSVPGILATWLIGFAILHPFLGKLIRSDRFVTMRLRYQVAIALSMLMTIVAYGGAKIDFIYFVF